MTLPPVFVISCRELPEREETTRQHFAASGVPVTFWRAPHGKTWGLDTTFEYQEGKRISSGHVSLLLAHWNLWQHLLHVLPADDSEAVVCEDDCVLPTDFRTLFGGVKTELARDLPDWEFVFLGLAESSVHVWQKITERLGPPDGKLCRMDEPFGTHCYLIRRRALPILMNLWPPAQFNADQQLYRRVLKDNHLVWAAVLPTLVKQRTFDYDFKGRPEWAASTVTEGDAAYPLAAAEAAAGVEAPGRPSKERIALTTKYTDPYPCLYKSEFLDEPGQIAAGRRIPLSVCARLDRPCHSKGDQVVTRTVWKGLARVEEVVVSCHSCELRLEMPADTARPRLPLPEGHFNPSMIQYRGKLLLATRDSWGHSKVALWELKNSLPDWTGEWSCISIGSYGSKHPQAPRLEDPRLFRLPKPDGSVRLAAQFNLPDGYPPKLVQVGFAYFDNDYSEGIGGTRVYPSPAGSLYEKNWAPFVTPEGELRWVYHTKPYHVILDQDGKVLCTTPTNLRWTAGAVRGGASPVLRYSERDQRWVYYHFFHGCLKRIEGSVYTVGCAVFDAEPPHKVLRMTPTPLIWPDLARHDEQTVKRYVVWPGGAVEWAGRWHVALGIDDTYCRIVSLGVETVEDALSAEVEAESDGVASIRDTPITLGISEESP